MLGSQSLRNIGSRIPSFKEKSNIGHPIQLVSMQRASNRVPWLLWRIKCRAASPKGSSITQKIQICPLKDAFDREKIPITILRRLADKSVQ